MRCGRSEIGLTLAEVLVAISLLAIVLVPAIRALHTGIVGANVHDDVTSTHYRLTARLEELLVEPFADLEDAAIAAGGPTVPSAYSDAAGLPNRLLVYLSYYDGDNADADDDPFTGTDADILWIRVSIENTVHGLETVSARSF